MLDTQYTLNHPPCICETIDGETIVINLDSGAYYHAQGNTATIWASIYDGYSPKQILASMTLTPAQYAIATTSIKNFIQQLLNEELIKENKNENIKETSPIVIDNDDWHWQMDQYTDMQELLSLDPIHRSDEAIGWPKEKSDETA